MDGTTHTVWEDPDVDETINHLEWAYRHRDQLREIGLRAGAHLKQFTWAKTAEQLRLLLVESAI